MNQENTQIQKIADNVQCFLDRETKTNKKINNIENKINNMQNYFSRPDFMMADDNEQKTAFNDYVRKGVENDVIHKSFSNSEKEGGVLVTPSLQQQIISQIQEKSVMRQIASIDTISSNALDVIIADGGFASGWVGESDKRTDTNTPKLEKKTIFAHELYAQPKATQKLIDDAAINIENWLSTKLADSFTASENEAFIKGDGDKKPSGLLVDKEIKSINNDSKKVSFELLLEMINLLDEQYLSGAVFLMNRSTLAAIQSLKDKNDRFIWQPSLSDSLKQTILGIPVLCSSYMPDMSKGNLAIALGDFKSGYKIVDRSGINIMRDPYTDKPFIKFYAVKRVGGSVINPDAIKFAKF